MYATNEVILRQYDGYEQRFGGIIVMACFKTNHTTCQQKLKKIGEIIFNRTTDLRPYFK